MHSASRITASVPSSEKSEETTIPLSVTHDLHALSASSVLEFSHLVTRVDPNWDAEVHLSSMPLPDAEVMDILSMA